MQMQQQNEEARRKEREEGLRRMLEADNQPIVENTEPFECPVCYVEIDPGEGLTLKQCLHQICKYDNSSLPSSLP